MALNIVHSMNIKSSLQVRTYDEIIVTKSSRPHCHVIVKEPTQPFSHYASLIWFRKIIRHKGITLVKACYVVFFVGIV